MLITIFLLRQFNKHLIFIFAFSNGLVYTLKNNARVDHRSADTKSGGDICPATGLLALYELLLGEGRY